MKTVRINNAALAFKAAPEKRRETSELILHHAAAEGSVQAIHNAHLARGWLGIGYHYYVRKDGSIWRGRDENCVGAHTLGHNLRSVGVCFEGNFEGEEMGEKQREAGLLLLRDIISRYPGLKISAHREHDNTACPGRNFPAELLEYNHSNEEGKTMDAEEFVTHLSGEQAYRIMEKAGQYAAALPLPEWAREEYAAAVAAGISDGEAPLGLVPRYQAAIMAARAKKE